MADDTKGAARNTVASEPAKPAAVAPIYGKPIFSWPKSENVNESRYKAGQKSTAAIDYAMPVGDGLIVKGTVYGNLEQISDGLKITFAASAPNARTIEFRDRASRETFLAHVEHAMLKWPAFDAATDAAQNRLTGVKAKSEVGKVARPELAPRLVKVAKTETTTAAPATA